MSQRRQMFDTSYRYTEGEIKKREGKTMKKMLFVLVVLGLFALTACSEYGYYEDIQMEPDMEYVKTEGYAGIHIFNRCRYSILFQCQKNVE